MDKKDYDEKLEARIGEPGFCEYCGGVGWLTLDPYHLDVNNTCVYLYLCDDCEDKRADDI